MRNFLVLAGGSTLNSVFGETSDWIRVKSSIFNPVCVESFSFVLGFHINGNILPICF